MIPGSRPEANWTRVPCSGRAKCGIIVSGPFIGNHRYPEGNTGKSEALSTLLMAADIINQTFC
jgi:hypothetical protein